MKGFYKKKDSKFKIQLFIIFTAICFIPSILFFRNRKEVVLNNLYEEVITRLPGFSSISNLTENNIPSEITSNKKKLFSLIEYFSKLPFQNFSEIRNSYINKNRLPYLNIKLPFDEYSIILNDRLDAVKKGYLSNPSWAKGEIKDSQSSKKIRIRLKGDLGDHWLASKRMSTRVKFIKDSGNSNSILGMREFSLHKLRSRQYPYEYLFSDLLESMGYPFVKHKIVNLKFNNENWGLMDMQEHFGSVMLEKNKLRDSLIYRFSDDKNWLIYQKNNELNNQSSIPPEDYWLSHPRLFYSLTGNSISKLNSVQLNQHFYIAKALMQDNYQEILFNERSLSEIEEILSIWGNFHPIANTNARYYFNPFTLKLDPLMQDQSIFLNINSKGRESIYQVTQGFLNPNLLNEKNRKDLHKSTFDSINKLIPYKTSQKLFPLDKDIDLSIPTNNFKFLQNFETQKYPLSNTKNIYKNKLICDLENLNADTNMPVLYTSFDQNQLLIYPLLCGEIVLKEYNICGYKSALNKIIKESNIYIDKPIKVDINLNDKFMPCDKKNNYLKYSYKNKNRIIDSVYRKNVSLVVNPLLDEQYPDFIKKDSNSEFLINNGNWNITKPIFIKGTLNIEKGTNLKFAPNSYLIVEGNINVKGTEVNPVIMSSIKNDTHWRGLYVFKQIKDEKISSINNLFVSNTKETDIGILDLTGGINFYNSKIVINGLNIENSIAEDSLNVVKSDINIAKLNIKNVVSDGFDCDYCTGNIKKVLLNRIGGDGLDFSGSNLEIKDLEGSFINDKLVSIGEESTIKLEIKKVKNSYLAAAVKDGSNANIKIFDAETIGPLVMVYDKKGFFEMKTFAQVKYIKDLEFFDKSFLRTPETTLIVNGKKINPTLIDIKYMYEQGPMKKN